jgi:hypothetical protein
MIEISIKDKANSTGKPNLKIGVEKITSGEVLIYNDLSNIESFEVFSYICPGIFPPTKIGVFYKFVTDRGFVETDVRSIFVKASELYEEIVDKFEDKRFPFTVNDKDCSTLKDHFEMDIELTIKDGSLKSGAKVGELLHKLFVSNASDQECFDALSDVFGDEPVELTHISDASEEDIEELMKSPFFSEGFKDD